MRNIVPVVLSGGSGTRLWPLSRPELPKQFLALAGDRTLFQQTLLRLAGLGNRVAAPIVVCNGAHESLVVDQLKEIAIEPAAIALEPVGRNTAPAVAVAALLAEQLSGAADSASGAGDLLLVLPADHVVRDEAAFVAAVDVAAAAASAGGLVTFGIVPDRPETGYGYIRQGAAVDRWFSLDRFVEKPDRDKAAEFVRSGDYLWNSGMFMFAPEAYLAELREHAPQMYERCAEAVRSLAGNGPVWPLGEAFVASPADSIDYAVMEKTANAVVVPLDAGWSDVGSWSALYEILPKDRDGNVIRGDVRADACSNCYLLATDRRLAVAGLADTAVVAAGGDVLVVPLSEAQRVKALAT